VGTAEKAIHITGASSPSDFLHQVVMPMLAMEGDKLPVRCGLGGGGWALGLVAGG